MKFSTKTRYGIRAMLEIALNCDHHGVFQKDIAQNQMLSIKYLDHIIPALKIAGLIANVKGKKSGYILTREASQITMYDIHKAFESEVCIVDCLEHKVSCKREKGCVSRQFWLGLNSTIIEHLKKVTLADLVKDYRMQNKEE